MINEDAHKPFQIINDLQIGGIFGKYTYHG